MSHERKICYVVATIHEWNIEEFNKRFGSLEDNWTLLTSPSELSEELLGSLNPRYVFFPHWSWRVPAEIVARYECVCFHMTDLPFGRGGSPLQNLISRGFSNTKLTALRMDEGYDSGPIYLKKDLSLSGSAHEIFLRSARLTFDMIEEIVSEESVPSPQVGEPVYFERRTPEMSELPTEGTLDSLYDHVRMLDAPGYPTACMNYGAFRIEFFSAARDSDGSVSVTATVKLRGKSEQ